MNLQQTISLIKSKDRLAEKTLFLSYAPKVLTLCRRYAAQSVEAQDYMQECFIQVFANINKFDDRKGEFDGWLYRVCTNRILELIRKSKRQVEVSFPESLPEQEFTDVELQLIPHEKVLKAIQNLPNGYREVFNLFVFEGWSHQQIGLALDIAEASSRSQLTRAKKMLKFNLQKKSNNHRYERQLV